MSDRMVFFFTVTVTSFRVSRFNAFAPELGKYVYTETGDDKTVYLTQYDNRTAGTGAELNFTRQEDMGWNMKGLPWLVSNYRTDTVLELGNYLRQMYIPHVFYQMDGDGDALPPEGLLRLKARLDAPQGGHEGADPVDLPPPALRQGHILYNAHISSEYNKTLRLPTERILFPDHTLSFAVRRNWHLFPACRGGCRGFTGPFPPPLLIRLFN